MMVISTIQKLCLFLLSFCGLSISHNLANILAVILFSKNSKKYHIAYKNHKTRMKNQIKHIIT